MNFSSMTAITRHFEKQMLYGPNTGATKIKHTVDQESLPRETGACGSMPWAPEGTQGINLHKLAFGLQGQGPGPEETRAKEQGCLLYTSPSPRDRG